MMKAMDDAARPAMTAQARQMALLSALRGLVARSKGSADVNR